MKKRMLSMLLAVVMVMGMSINAMAEDTQDIDPVTGTADVDLTGTVQSTSKVMSVVVPTQIIFNLVAEEKNETVVASKGDNAVTDTKGNILTRVDSGTGTVTNNSWFKIDMEISQVVDDDNLLDKMDLGVMSTSDDATTVMGESTALATPLTTTSTKVQLLGGLDGKGENGEDPSGVAKLKVVGQAAKGTYTTDSQQYPVNIGANDTAYTVVTTLKVTASAD